MIDPAQRDVPSAGRIRLPSNTTLAALCTPDQTLTLCTATNGLPATCYRHDRKHGRTI